MTPELTALALAVLLQAVQFALLAVPANREASPGYMMSSRDGPPPAPLSDRTSRLKRAFENHFEGLILFTAAVVLVVLADRSSPLTQACAWTYLAARVLYVPAYAFGWNPWRSVIWMIGFLATIIMVISTLI
jgi:uncharacterized MAPEG superfamily protein